MSEQMENFSRKGETIKNGNFRTKLYIIQYVKIHGLYLGKLYKKKGPMNLALEINPCKKQKGKSEQNLNE